MTVLYLLIPLTLLMGLVGLAGFVWNLASGQYEDLAGAAERVLDDADAPLPRRARPKPDRSEEDAQWSQT